jgi:hypothetical protein
MLAIPRLKMSMYILSDRWQTLVGQTFIALVKWTAKTKEVAHARALCGVGGVSNQAFAVGGRPWAPVPKAPKTLRLEPETREQSSSRVGGHGIVMMDGWHRRWYLDEGLRQFPGYILVFFGSTSPEMIPRRYMAGVNRLQVVARSSVGGFRVLQTASSARLTLERIRRVFHVVLVRAVCRIPTFRGSPANMAWRNGS